MLTRRLFVALAFSAAAVTSGSAFAKSPDPATIVKSIYGKRDPYGAGESVSMRAKHRRALSKSLAALWKRSDDATPAEDEPVPGFDISANSNAREVSRAEVTVEKQDATHAMVAAKLFSKDFKNKNPSDDIVRYELIRENGRWVIDNIRSTIDGKEWTIKGLLTEGLKS